MREFGSRDDGASKRILNALETVKLIFRKAVVEGVTIVKFRVDKGSRNGTGSFVVERRTNAAKIANMKKAAFGEGRYLFIKIKMAVEDETKIASRDRR